MDKSEPNPYHVRLMRQESVARILHELERLILATPSGNMRNQLCDMSITVLQHQKALEQGSEHV